ncbi:hypothetical protein [Jannaschia sp. W003]|uniref:hypothetical protein n=1 Tax=Jannaschia sp. W003 TaxID=2867012 RepID=UPI0021A5B8D4|nr:hypothetical protein [Jannaschia sp. W003]UWQ22434.1 hypothetical protein K3554_05230 [Jannaschia sp. W003]
MTPADPGGGAVPFDEFLLLVGKLNYSWTNTESLLIHLIARLVGCDDQTATVMFLTLNSTRARLDLVERLAKLERVPAERRETILALTSRFAKLSGLRNRYSHCIYSFDQNSGAMRTILMRIADRKHSIKVGQTSDIDRSAAREVQDAIDAIAELNIDIWRAVGEAFPDQPAKGAG